MATVIERDQKQDEEERNNAKRALELEQAATAVAQKERDLALEKAVFYESLYKGVTKKKGGFGCTIKRIFTFGFARCG